MALTIRYQPEHDLVSIKTAGEIPFQALVQQFSEAAQIAQGEKTHKFLFDGTDLYSPVSTVDIYEVPNMLLSAGFSRSSRIAVLVAPDEDGMDDFKFLETVGVNQGINIKMFTGMEEAYNWLNPR